MLFKFFIILLAFFELVIRHIPIPQLNVLSISVELILPMYFNQLKIRLGCIFSPYIIEHNLSGITLGRFSMIPPPVICAHAFKFLL